MPVGEETQIVNVEIETGEPLTGNWNARWASLKIAGVTVFRDMVYDTDKDGNRTAAQARQNLMLLFQAKMQRLLEDS